MAPETINRKAKELLDNGKIGTRLSALRAPAVEKAQMTLESHLNDLRALRDKAERAEKYSAAVAAEVARGRASGFYTEKLEHSGSLNNLAADLDARIAAARARARPSIDRDLEYSTTT